MHMKKIILLILLSLLIFSLILYHTERLGLAIVISLTVCVLIIMAASYLMEHAYIKDINSKDHHK